ncbi:hypothetical protein [Spiroplasma endosymbiont of Danaus chrysippus]|uniref:hypothetical protein n=1 Tax=Spiroplasma endosymbiont of Danaus chrysippus TaxID=2691041 RepID=UPI00157A4738|nr:hypothetical protein [Spiroplasma endosymbiont of Danaus chrysippus]
MNKCTFNQTTKFTSLIPPHDEHFEQLQCENMTEEQFDEYGRAYCKEHRNQVDEINKSRHKNCINKEKILNYFRNTIGTNGNFNILKSQELTAMLISQMIENGEFDNE